MALKIQNDRRASLTVARELLVRAGQLMTPENGQPLTIEQEENNQKAADLVEYANEIRARFGLGPQQPPRAASASAPAADPFASGNSGWSN